MDDSVAKLVIRAPNQQIDDQIVKCELGWTVKRLKDYLSEVYPNKPRSTDQKLIYFGQLLNDSVCLKDVLRHHDSSEEKLYTVHLVCSGQRSPVNQMRPEEDATRNSPTHSNQAHPENSGSSRLHEQTSSPLDNPNNPQQASTFQPFSFEQYYGQLNSQQIAWMQQAYSHYLMQYMQLMSAQGIQLQTSIPHVQPVNVNNDTQNNNAPNNNNVNNNNVNNNNVNEEDNEQRELLEDGFGQDIPEEGLINRDWLDTFYMFSRIIVLFSIVYFYSSPIRFLIVSILGFGIYLYQNGFFRIQPILLANNNNGRVENNNQILQNEAIGPQVPQQQVPTVQAEARTNNNEVNEVVERPGALAFTWTFLSSFFASLIPEQQNVI